MSYHPSKFMLSKSQVEKIVQAVKNDKDVTLRYPVSGSIEFYLPLTTTQASKISKNNPCDITFSKTQVKNIMGLNEKYREGGLLPLITLIPLIASVLGGIGGLTGGIASAVTGAKQNSEKERHDREVEKQLQGSGLYLNPQGRSIQQDYNQLATQNLNRQQIRKVLKQYHGSGVVSDFLKNIPILGNLLSPIASTIGLGLKRRKSKPNIAHTSASGVYL